MDMSDFSVDGLSSGLDTTSIIEQLMAVEQQPVRRLEARRADLNSKVSAWEDLDGRLGTLSTAIDTLLEGSGLNVLSGVASNPDVGVATSGEGAVGVFEMTVDQIATSHQLMSGRFDDPAALVGAGRSTVTAGLGNIGAASADIGSSETGHYTVQITAVDAGTATIVFNGESHDVSSTGVANLTNEDGSTVTLTPGGEFTKGSATISTMVTDGATTVGAMVNQLSDPSGAATLQVVDSGDGTATPFTLVASARTPGVNNSLVLDMSSATLGGFTEIREAQNTIVTMGDGDLVIERSDVSVSGLVPGMVVDLSGAEIGEELRVTVNRDTEAALENARTFVDAANAFFSGVSSYGRSDPENDTVGLLSGEFSLRRLTDQVRGAFSTVGSGAFVIGRQVGIDIGQDGTISLNESTFTDLMASDFGDLQTFLIGDGEDGYLGRIQAAIAGATDTDGVINNATTNLDESIDNMGDTIARYERRLETVEAGYRRQFTAMETLLAQLNSQSSFLSNQLSGLNG
jgi:flagellar hook-associated protein 2